MRTPNDDVFNQAWGDGMHPDDAGPIAWGLEYWVDFRPQLATVMHEDGIKHKWVSKWRIKKRKDGERDGNTRMAG